MSYFLIKTQISKDKYKAMFAANVSTIHNSVNISELLQLSGSQQVHH